MQDIRKPYTRSRSSNDLQSRVEQFEAARYKRDDYYDDEPVAIPVKKTRRDVRDMDMYPKRRQDDDFYDDTYEDEDLDRRAPSRERRTPRKKLSLGTLSFIVVTILLVIAVSLYTYVFDSATITIVPKYKDINDVTRVFTFTQNGTDPSSIPYVVASTSLSKTKTLTLSESRKVEAKASGKITVFNNYDSAPQKLIKNTRFESSKGKIYRIAQSIEVPGKKGDVPGSIDVTVYADNNGADYNMTTGDFTIPGFKGTPREKAFYAKTKTAISGGSSGTMSLVALSDLNAAKDALAVELGKDIQAEILKLKKDGYIPLYSAAEITYEDNQDELLKGVTAVYKVTATGNLMFADAAKFAEALAKTFPDYASEPVRLAGADTLTFTRKQTEHVTGTSALSILVEGKTRVVWDSNIAGIKEMVEGKKRDEFKPLMKTINSIESAEIDFSPLWLSHFPSDVAKITITESLPKR